MSIGQQAIVANALKARGEGMQEETVNSSAETVITLGRCGWR
jgi:hypothetical protein